MAVSIEDVKKLREATGVSMMACKKALEDTNGDFDGAIDELRKKGIAKAAERVGRSTSQGAIIIKEKNGKAAMVELLCETDFVARGDDFLKVAEALADKLLNGEIKPEDRDIPEVQDAALKLGEHVKIEDVKLMDGENIGDYVHSNNKIGVLVSLKGGDKQTAKDIAMHIAATNPAVLSPDEVSQALVDKEKEIWAEQLKSEGKPMEIIEKIMLGKEKKFREENALLKQPFVKDPEKTVEQLLSTVNGVIEEFKRFSI